jgi:arylsulfatase A-like enzyme
MSRPTALRPLLPIRLAAALCLGLALSAVVHAAQRPHVVVLLADDLGWQDLGYLGKEVRTPRIDALAARGVRLNQYYVTPWSTQTRAALLTGRYPMRYGLQTQSILPASGYGLPLDEKLLSQSLKEAGYRTAFVGKWQLGHARPELRPTRRGFDHHYGPLMGQVDPFRRSNALGPDWWRNDKPVKEEGYVTTLLGREAATVVSRHDPSAPLFLVVSFTAPAAPMAAPKDYLDRNAAIRDETRRTYAAMVSAVDDAVGAVVDALDRKGMLADTLLLFHTDNGGAVPRKHPSGDGDVERGAADNGPYREGMGGPYEGGSRVPAVLHWPAKLEPGIASGLMHVTDIYPTVLAAAGVKPDQRKALDGVDQWKMIRDNALSPRKDVLIALDDLQGVLRVGDWKLVVSAGLPGRVELYDVNRDPGEEDNAADRFPERVAELSKRLNDYAWEMVPSLFLAELAGARRTPVPMVWGMNPLRHGAGADADSRRDPSLSVERADQPSR